jgi:hypothetical protein
MNEGDLKAKWRRQALKHGFAVRAMSPHQIPGMPDLLVTDIGADDVIRTMRRTRQHWIEAKVAKLGPRQELVFSAARDATPNQIRWLLLCVEMGAPGWWLVLDPAHWAIVPARTLELKRPHWHRIKRKYGARIPELEEPERNRAKLVKAAEPRLARVELEVVRLGEKRAR